MGCISKLENAIGIEDLYALSKCDYIFGPPSTFSMWASFYGEVPLKFFETTNEKFSLNDFSVIRYQCHFENGTEYIPLSNRKHSNQVPTLLLIINYFKPLSNKISVLVAYYIFRIERIWKNSFTKPIPYARFGYD